MKDFFSKCDQIRMDLVTFNKKILNGKLHFLRRFHTVSPFRGTFRENPVKHLRKSLLKKLLTAKSRDRFFAKKTLS